MNRKTILVLVGILILASWMAINNYPKTDREEEKEVCIYDAIEIIINCTYSLEEAEASNV